MTLYPHQQQALEQTAQFNRVAYYHDMGLGKTYTGAEKLHQLNADQNLLVCQKSKISDWIQHFKDNYDYEIHDLSKKFEPFDHGIGIINYDLVFRRNLSFLHDFTLMLDESSEIQNEKAKRSKAILKLPAKNVILLSGSPTGGKYEKLWSQCHLLGWNISKDLYYSQYVESHWEDTQGFRRQVIDGYKNVDRLKRKLREHGALFLKTNEVMQLPEQTFIQIKTKTPKNYWRFLKDRYLVLNGKEYIGDSPLTARLYSRMFCGYLNPDRLQAFQDLINSTDDRLIVFYNFTAELEALLPLSNRPVSIINGETKDLSNYTAHSNSITFIQYQAGAMGLNLQLANKIIYFSLPERSELFEQSKKRIHRIGQDKPCFYYIMLCPKSVEEHIYENLEKRRDYTDELFRQDCLR